MQIEGAQPEEHGTLIQVGDNGDTPFIVPARVVDASQGWAAWFVSRDKVVALMNAGVKSHRVDEAILEDFEPIDCGEGRSMVVLLGIDYRVSDFGRYHEIALAICVTPKEAAAQPGVAVRPAVGQRPVLGRADAARLGLSQGFLQRPACLLWRQLRAVLHRARGRQGVLPHCAAILGTMTFIRASAGHLLIS